MKRIIDGLLFGIGFILVYGVYEVIAAVVNFASASMLTMVMMTFFGAK